MALRIKKQVQQALTAARNGEAANLSELVIPRVGGHVIAKANGEKNTRTFLISNKAQDRDKDTIDPFGWELEDFRKNGAILWAHNSWEPPVATPGEVSVRGSAEDAALFGDAKFVEAYPFAKLLLNLIDEGALKNASVGFSPVEWIYNEERGGVDFIKQKLVEWSVVPIGSNPDAMVQLAKDGNDLSPMLEWSQRWLDNDEKIGNAIADDVEVAAICKALEPFATTIDPGVAARKDESDEGEPATELEQKDDEADEGKAGRVLSRANKDKLRQASELVLEVLAAATKDEDEEEEDLEEEQDDGEEGEEEDDDKTVTVESTTKTLDDLLAAAEALDIDDSQRKVLVESLTQAKQVLAPEPIELNEDVVREWTRDALAEATRPSVDEPAIDAKEATAFVRSALEEFKSDILRRTGRLPA